MSDTQNDNLAQLRKQADRATQLEEQNAQMARRIAFMEAGIDYTKGTGKLLFDAYDGDLTREAVSSKALEYGVAPAPTGEPAPAPAPQGAPVNPDFVADRQRLVHDGVPAGAPPERVRTNPYDAALMNKQAGVRNGDDPDVLLAQGVAAVMGAAKMGDERVLVKRERDGYTDPRKYA